MQLIKSSRAMRAGDNEFDGRARSCILRGLKMNTSPLPTVLLKPGEADRLVAGHPWVYAGEVLRLSAPAEDGALV